MSYGVAKGIHHVAPPARTDDDGELYITVPLGAEETTWRVALVGMPDGARPATTWVDVPSNLPLSVKVEAGARWVVGDRGEALVQLRNRTDKALEVNLTIAGEAGLRTSKPSAKLSVPAGGAASLRVPLEAHAVGKGLLRLQASAAGVPADEHERTQQIGKYEPRAAATCEWGPRAQVGRGWSGMPRRQSQSFSQTAGAGDSLQRDRRPGQAKG